jgi:hypothetical protein
MDNDRSKRNLDAKDFVNCPVLFESDNGICAVEGFQESEEL